MKEETTKLLRKDIDRIRESEGSQRCLDPHETCLAGLKVDLVCQQFLPADHGIESAHRSWDHQPSKVEYYSTARFAYEFNMFQLVVLSVASALAGVCLVDAMGRGIAEPPSERVALWRRKARSETVGRESLDFTADGEAQDEGRERR